ncbi:hypothetical protein ACFL9T_05255 [Thermodesulfobacteriota bacterium]
MTVKRRHALLILLPRVFPAKAGAFPVRPLKRFDKTRSLGEKWEDIWTRFFLKFFLWFFKKAFEISEDFRENIKNFEAQYLFRTDKDSVHAFVMFEQGAMEVHAGNKDHPPNVTVTFKNADVLQRYLFSLAKGRDQGILELLLANDVQLDGNWNYIHKFLFMVGDLHHRLRFWE